MITTASRIFGLLFAAFLIMPQMFFGATAQAQDGINYDAARSVYVTRQFVVGSASKYTTNESIPGVGSASYWGGGQGNTIETGAAGVVAAFNACYSVAGAACRIGITGYADSVRYGTQHDPKNGGLANARAARAYSVVTSMLSFEYHHQVVQNSGEETSIEGKRAVVFEVYIERAVLISPSSDGTAAVAVKAAPRISREQLLSTIIGLNRVLRDVSDRKCPWRVEVRYNVPSDVVAVHIVRTDPRCVCDGEHPFDTEGEYESAVRREYANPPLPFPEDTAYAWEQYGAIHSVFTDEIGAEWNEALFYSHGILTISKQRNVCFEMDEEHRARGLLAAERDRLGFYDTDGFVGAAIDGGGSFRRDGSPFDTAVGPDASAHLQAGVVLGGSSVAWILGAGFGAAWDPNCLVPGQFDVQAFTGPWLNRQGQVGFQGLIHGSFGFAPYNGEWVGNRYRTSVIIGVPIQLDTKGHKPTSKLYLIPQGGVGLDFVSAKTDNNVFVTTERPGGWLGIGIWQTF